MKRIISAVLSGVIVFAGVFFLTACKEGIPYEYTQITGHEYDHEIATVVGLVVDSVNGIEELKKDVTNSKVTAKLDGYGEDFFAEKKIVFVSVVLSQGEGRTLESVSLDNDNSIVVHIKKPVNLGGGYAQVITTEYFIIELDKTVGSNTVRVEEK